jgi:hypothetical protein
MPTLRVMMHSMPSVVVIDKYPHSRVIDPRHTISVAFAADGIAHDSSPNRTTLRIAGSPGPR